MALVLTPVQNKKETQPIELTLPSGEKILLVVNHCEKRIGAIKVKIACPEDVDVLRLPSQKSLIQLRKQKRLVQALND